MRLKLIAITLSLSYASCARQGPRPQEQNVRLDFSTKLSTLATLRDLIRADREHLVPLCFSRSIQEHIRELLAEDKEGFYRAWGGPLERLPRELLARKYVRFVQEQGEWKIDEQ